MIIGCFDINSTTLTLYYKYDGENYQNDYEYWFKDNDRNPLRPILCLDDGRSVVEFNSLPNYSYEEQIERMKEGE